MTFRNGPIPYAVRLGTLAQHLRSYSPWPDKRITRLATARRRYGRAEADAMFVRQWRCYNRTYALWGVNAPMGRDRENAAQLLARWADTLTGWYRPERAAARALGAYDPRHSSPYGDSYRYVQTVLLPLLATAPHTRRWQQRIAVLLADQRSHHPASAQGSNPCAPVGET